MALKSKTVEIEGASYHVGQITATRSVKLIARLGRLLGPALAEIARLFDGVEFDAEKGLAGQEIDLSKAGEVVRVAFSGLNDAEIDGLLKELLSNVAVLVGPGAGALEGDLKKIDAAFSGNLDALFRVLFASLEVNFGSFFGVLAAVARSAGTKAAASAPRPSATSST